MKRHLLLLIFIAIINFTYCQSVVSNRDQVALNQEIDSLILEQYRRVKPYFEEAYALNPTIPRGILEAVSFTYTRFCHRIPGAMELSENSIPATYGVMGLTMNGKEFFRENLKYISRLSGYSIFEIMESPRSNILSYAAAYAELQRKFGIGSELEEQRTILNELSELPVERNEVLDFASNSNLYAIYSLLCDSHFCYLLTLSPQTVNFEHIFGSALPQLQSSFILLNESNIEIPSALKRSHNDTLFLPEAHGNLAERADSSRERSTDYAGALWAAAGTCNYSNRTGHNISSVTIHYTAGTYAGCIAWFQNCTYNGVGSQVSAHYVIRSIDGQITQMVREADKAWHAGSANSYTVGLEHEAYGDIQSYFTSAMYQASANLTRDICERNGISPLRMFYRDTLDDGTLLNTGLHSLGSETACIKIRGHQHYPDQTHTDPGPYWNWNYYYKLVNNNTPVTTYNAATGTFTDSGGDTANYSDDERQLFLISVEDAERISLTFSEFELEDDYDFMWIYDGNSVFSPLIGRWNTQSPGIVTSTGNSLLIEFRSDCGTTDAGWQACWQAIIPVSDNPPTTAISFNETQWITRNFNLNFTDADDHALAYQFYQIMGNDGRRWTANNKRGFFCDNFDDLNSNLWQINSGNWSVSNAQLHQTSLSSSTISTELEGSLSDSYLYDFYGKFVSTNSTQNEFGVYLHSNRRLFENNETAYYIAFSPTEQIIRFYKISRGYKAMVHSISNIRTTIGTNYFYRILHNQQTGAILLFRNGILLGQWQDSAPLATRSLYFAFHTNQATIIIDNFRVYRSRGNSARINVGAGINNDAIYQAANGTPKTKIKSIVMDDAMQFSTLAEKSLKVDYTPPIMPRSINDGTGMDLDLITNNIVSANWNPASDPHSGIYSYEYQLTPSLYSELAAWTSVGANPYFSKRIRLTNGERYYVRIHARNNAGLVSPYATSDGFIYQPQPTYPTTTYRDVPNFKISIYPNPTDNELN
ncbi:MAG: N-acetylmuramoyl-L-alanine amidase, partial [Bacteroidales bacterium]|nr:N-acetylmuramoyl-L-alanine amidase [Bacteroidales bacterium]